MFAGRSGWLHLPPDQAPQRDLALVISAALGREGRCTYRPLRLLARQAASAGFVTVRFDPLGEGGSQDLDPLDGALESWTQGLETALGMVRHLDGVRQAALLGIRSGALIACTARSAVDRLYLLAPTLSGRSWLAKLRFAARRRGGAGDEDDPHAAFDAPDLWLSTATLDALSGVDLMNEAGWPDTVIVAANGGLTTAFEARLRGLGSDVRRIAFPGLENLFLDPNVNEAPQTVFQDLLSDLGAASSPLAPRPASAVWRRFREAGAEDPVLTFSGGSETAVRLAGGLAGVLCRPTSPASGRPGLIFLNTGADPMAGVGRFAVQAQRYFASVHGLISLRFDFSGIGDSDAGAPPQAPHVYATPRGKEVGAAASALEAEGCARILLIGISAGAYHAVRELIAQENLSGAFAVSALKLVWRPGDSLAIGDRRWGRASRAYLRDARSLSTWLRLLRGEIKASSVMRTLIKRLGAHLATAPDLEVTALRDGVRAVSRRGGRIHLLMGIEDASEDEIEGLFGRGGKGFVDLPGMSLTIHERLDHGLVYQTSRRLALEALENWLQEDFSGRPPEPNAGGSRRGRRPRRPGP